MTAPTLPNDFARCDGYERNAAKARVAELEAERDVLAKGVLAAELLLDTIDESPNRVEDFPTKDTVLTYRAALKLAKEGKRCE